MKIVVTGGSGYVARAFLERHAGVFSQIVVPVRSGPSVADLPARGVPYDGSLEALCDLIARERPDAVLHAAAAGVRPGDRNASTLACINGVWPMELYRAASAAGCRGFVHLGSMAEYAAPDGHMPLRESDPVAYANHYGASKAAATALLATVAQERCPVLVLRLFGLYGPGEAQHRLTRSLIDRLQAGERVPLSLGTQIRDFVFLLDVVDALNRSLDHALGTDKAFEILNIGSGKAVSVRAFAERLCAVLGAPGELLDFGALPMRDTDAPYLVAEMSRTARVLGWTPAWSLQDGLEATVRAGKITE